MTEKTNLIEQITAALVDRTLFATKEVLTLDEAARYLHVSKSQMYKYTNAREIPHSRPTGRRCYFSRAELEKWLMRNPIATRAELEREALNYKKGGKQ